MADVLQSTQANNCPTKPIQVYSKLKQICRHLIHGHQEDAHEFLRYLMESMEKAFLTRYKNNKEFEQYTKETTPINQILGGYLRTSVKCLSCQYESVTFQHFEDLLLDIRKVSTIEDALKYHFARERLEDMDYTCESCKKKVSATKQFSLERAPIALCIQLKRFSGINGKISKHIHISQEIDFSQYSSKDVKNSQLKYRLVSMITHLGSTPQCGHYTAIGCCQDGTYYQFDDSSVRPMSLNSLLNTNPYIIFYELIAPKQPTTVTSMSHNENNNKRTETSTQFIGPLLPAAANQLNKSILTPINGTKTTYGSTSNGFSDNRKLIVSNNQLMSPKNNIDTVTTSSPSTAVAKSSPTNGTSSNETLTKNEDKSSIKLDSLLVLPSMNISLQQQTPANKISNESSTKKSEDSRNSSSSDSELEIQPSPKVAVLPNMPELKSNSPTAHKPDENTKSSNGIQTTTTEDYRTIVKRISEPENSSPLKGIVTVVNSPAKMHSTSTGKNEEAKKMFSQNYREESGESQQKSNSLQQSNNSVRVTMNPFSRDNNNSIKNTKHKTNGYGNHHGTYNQRNSKPITNGYATCVRKSLVPYSFNDDSDSNNEERKTPPMVKTKAGPFQVTNGNSTHWTSDEQRLPWSNSSISTTGGRVPSLSTWSGGSSLLGDEVSKMRT